MFSPERIQFETASIDVMVISRIYSLPSVAGIYVNHSTKVREYHHLWIQKLGSVEKFFSDLSLEANHNFPLAWTARARPLDCHYLWRMELFFISQDASLNMNIKNIYHINLNCSTNHKYYYPPPHYSTSSFSGNRPRKSGVYVTLKVHSVSPCNQPSCTFLHFVIYCVGQTQYCDCV